MSKITQRRQGELVRGVFKLLLDHSEGLPAQEILEKLGEILPPTEFEKTTYPNHPDTRRYEHTVRFATIGPTKAGWLIKDRGRWTLTETGRRAYQEFPDPEQFIKEAGRLYRQWAAGQSEGAEDSPDAATTMEGAEEAAWAEIEEFLKAMNPYDFQQLIAGLLQGMGYHIQWVAPPGRDGGIDIIANSDPLGIRGPRIKVQVKRRSEKAAIDSVRSLLALLSESDVGIFVAIGGFTREAEEEVRRQERRRLILIDLQRLFDLWVEHYNRVPESARRLLPIRPIYFLDLGR